MFHAEFSLGEPGSGNVEPDAVVEATSDTGNGDEVSAPRLTRNQLTSADARKRKMIDIPMI